MMLGRLARCERVKQVDTGSREVFDVSRDEHQIVYLRRCRDEAIDGRQSKRGIQTSPGVRNAVIYRKQAVNIGTFEISKPAFQKSRRRLVALSNPFDAPSNFSNHQDTKVEMTFVDP